MTAYYVKKLLQKSLRVLETYPKEVRAKQDLRQMAAEKHDQVLKLTAWNRLKEN